jgi:hypothetical protein
MSICLLHVPRCIPACARSHLYAHNGQCADLHCPERAQNAHPMRVRERAAAGDGCQRCHRTVHRCRAPRQRPHPRENLAPVYIFGSRLGPPHETASRALVHHLVHHLVHVIDCLLVAGPRASSAGSAVYLNCTSTGVLVPQLRRIASSLSTTMAGGE